MSAIKIKSKGDHSKTRKFFQSLKARRYLTRLNEMAELGVQSLKAATPVDTGKTASSWSYEIVQEDGRTTIRWLNSNVVDNRGRGVNIAVILQYGHGTGTGGYVTGIDYINPALKPVFDSIAENAWKEVMML